MKSCLNVMLKETRLEVLLLFVAIIFALGDPLYSEDFTFLSSLTVASSNAGGLIATPEPGWPQWRGSQRDGISDEKDLLDNWLEGGPKLLWKIDGLGTGWSCPIIVGRRIYITGDVGDNLIIFAFDLNGEVQWKVKNGWNWKNPYPGARACCVFSEGRLYCLDEKGSVGLLKPGPTSLEIVGRFALVTEKVRDAWAHPVLLDGRLYLRYHDTLFCYDVKRHR